MMQTTIRLTEDLYQKIKRMAEKKGLTINAIIILALWEYVKKGE